MGSARSCLLTNKDDPDQPIITSKTNARTSQVSSPEAVAPKLLAWASKQNNKIRMVELETKNELVDFGGSDQPIITSKTNVCTSQVSPTEAVVPKLLAWSSKSNNKISTVELETKNELVNFDGVQLENPIRIFQLSYIS